MSVPAPILDSTCRRLLGGFSSHKRLFALRERRLKAAAGRVAPIADVRLPPPTRVTLYILVKRILFIFGTRPEAIKLCPVVRYMRESGCRTPDGGVRHRAAPRHVGSGAGMLRRAAGLRSGSHDAGTDSLADHGAGALRARSHSGRGKFRHGGGTGRYHQHAGRRDRRVLPSHPGGPCGSRAQNGRPDAAVPRGNESRGHRTAGRATLRAHAELPAQSTGRAHSGPPYLRHRKHGHRRRFACSQGAGTRANSAPIPGPGWITPGS